MAETRFPKGGSAVAVYYGHLNEEDDPKLLRFPQGARITDIVNILGLEKLEIAYLYARHSLTTIPGQERTREKVGSSHRSVLSSRPQLVLDVRVF